MARTVAVVLNWRRVEETFECVKSLLALEADLDVVVVDNDSGDSAISLLKVRLAKEAGPAVILAERAAGDAEPWREAGQRAVLFVQSGRNGGYAFGNNVGVDFAMKRGDCEFIWILNNDTFVPDASSLNALVEKMDRDPAIGICGSTVAYLGRRATIQSRGGGEFSSITGQCQLIGVGEDVATSCAEEMVEARLAYVNGAAAFVRRSLIEAVGPMREDYFLYFEEIDWAFRIRKHFKLGYAARSLVYHAVGASIGSDDTGLASPMSKYYLSRNRLLFLRRHALIGLPFAVFETVRNMLHDFKRGDTEGGKAIARALLGVSFQGHRGKAPAIV